MAYTVASRARACESDSSTSMPAPSPSTNPSLALSNGRDARSGSSFLVDMARITAKAPMFSGMIADPAGDAYAEPLGVYGGRARVGPCLAGGHQGKLLAAVHPAGLHATHHLDRVGGRLRGESHRQRLRPRLAEGVHATAARQHRRPGRRNVPAKRGGRAEPGNDDGLAPFGHAGPPAFLLT